jgi:hypothetical protein
MPDYDEDTQAEPLACYPSPDGSSTAGDSAGTDGSPVSYYGVGGADSSASAAAFGGMYGDGAGGAGPTGNGASGSDGGGSANAADDKSWWQGVKDWWYGEPKAPVDDPRADLSDIRCSDPKVALADPANCGPTVDVARPQDPSYMTPEQRLEFLRTNPIGGAIAGAGMMAGQDEQFAVQRANQNMKAIAPIVDGAKSFGPKITPYKKDSTGKVEYGPQGDAKM